MTDAELGRIEALFLNPPSASGLAELGLELVAELKRLRLPAAPAPVAPVAHEASPVHVEDHAAAEKPTPPASPAAKRGTRK
jgi:hypothetical protein